MGSGMKGLPVPPWASFGREHIILTAIAPCRLQPWWSSLDCEPPISCRSGWKCLCPWPWGVSLGRHILSSEITKPSSYRGDLSASIKGKGKIPVPYWNVGCPLLKRQLENFPSLRQTQGLLKTSAPHWGHFSCAVRMFTLEAGWSSALIGGKRLLDLLTMV